MRTATARLPIALAAVLTAGAGSALAQSRSSFLEVDAFQDITVTMNSAVSYTVALGASPSVTIGATTYDVTDLFGFWVLSNDDDFAVATGTDQGVWDYDENSAGTGDIAGFKTNPNLGLEPGESFTFVFDSLDAARIDQYGFHIRVDGVWPGTNGNTGFATNVPAPGAAALLGLGGLLASRRRR